VFFMIWVHGPRYLQATYPDHEKHGFVARFAAARDCGDPSQVLGRDGLLTIAENARPHYLTPASMLIPFGPDNGPAGSWVLPSVVTGPGGQRWGSFTFQDVPAACRNLWPTPSYPSCMTDA
jgi:hypothetical protein